jgi:hypothetical protein
MLNFNLGSLLLRDASRHKVVGWGAQWGGKDALDHVEMTNRIELAESDDCREITPGIETIR